MNDSALSTERRHEIDALRVLVLLLLIPFHSLIGFSPFGKALLTPQNDELLVWAPVLMSLTNTWRIPILFVVSGMAVWFSLRRLSANQVLLHRLKRITGPLVLGWFVMGPFLLYTGSSFFSQLDQYQYEPYPHYLWFLNNILVYIISLTHLAAYVASDSGQALRQRLADGWRRGYVPLLALGLFAIEGWIINPYMYSIYFVGIHGWILGLLCFALGLCCAAGGADFRLFVFRFRYVMLALASAFWLANGIHFTLNDETMMPNVFIGMQCLITMGAVLGLATAHLSKTTPFFHYARSAVFPVYILHYPIQFILSYFLFPLALPAVLKLIILVSGVFLLSVAIYEFVVRRVPVLDTLFGLTRKE
jgi:glucan biosynthesis protein C